MSRFWQRIWCNFFTLQGRAGRLEVITKFIMLNLSSFVLAFFVSLFAVGIAASMYGFESAKHGTGILKIMSLPFLWAVIAVKVRRLHDLNLSGWWELSFFIVPALAVAVLMLAKHHANGQAISGVALVTVIAMLAAVVIGGLALLLWPGNKNENRFGPVSEI
jgi:uncharacterized membrane protein YhaH (DUF805 family)